jgi:hypothetical protein
LGAFDGPLASSSWWCSNDYLACRAVPRRWQGSRVREARSARYATAREAILVLERARFEYWPDAIFPAARWGARFAFELRKLRAEAGGIACRAMARQAGYSAADKRLVEASIISIATPFRIPTQRLPHLSLSCEWSRGLVCGICERLVR